VDRVRLVLTDKFEGELLLRLQFGERSLLPPPILITAGARAPPAPSG
jgi:hypothetical protein